MDARIVEIHTHPTKGEPGLTHSDVDVEADGLAGDRRKKAAVHLVSSAQAEGARANFVLDLGVDELSQTVGQQIRLGDVVLHVAGPAGNCPGVFADVVQPGTVQVGDAVTGVAATDGD